MKVGLEDKGGRILALRLISTGSTAGCLVSRRPARLERRPEIGSVCPGGDQRGDCRRANTRRQPSQQKEEDGEAVPGEQLGSRNRSLRADRLRPASGPLVAGRAPS